MAILVGSRSEVEPLRDESAIADSWVRSVPESSRDVEWRVAYKTTTFPCRSLNRDGTLLSTWGLIVASGPGRWPKER